MKPLFLLVLLLCSSITKYSDNYAAKTQSAWIAAALQFEINAIEGFELRQRVAITDLVEAPEHVINYLAKSENIRRAVAAAAQIGCPPSIMLAHDGIESAWHDSSLFGKTKNSGNIKCSCNGTGKRARAFRTVHQRLADNGQPVCIRAFDPIEKSNHYYKVMPTLGHAWAEKTRILCGYAAIKKAKKNGFDLKQWCQAFEDSPYSTDVGCAEKLWRVINTYDFTAIDEAVKNGYCITTTGGKYCLWLPI